MKLRKHHAWVDGKYVNVYKVEDLWEWLDRMSTKYPDDPIHVLRELHLKLEEK